MLALLLALQDPGPVYSGIAKQLDVRIPRFEAQVKIDGVLDEPVWNRAAMLTGFSQYRPVDGRPAEDSTAVLVWYAPDAIYFGIRAFERHGAVVRATLADRDNIDSDDNVAILLDTYLDHRRATMFAVNPLGVQQDGVWSDGVAAGAAGGPSAGGRFDATIDLNPDYVYESRGRVTDRGYEVEVRIPFKSLRYQSADPQDWGIQIVRAVQHSGYEETWTPAVRASASFLIQAGRLVGLTALRRGLVLDLTPEFTTKVDGAPTTPGYDYRGTPEVAGNVRWGMTQNLGATATAHPDFSQVEADIGQVTSTSGSRCFIPRSGRSFSKGSSNSTRPTASFTRGASCSRCSARSSPARSAAWESPTSAPWTTATSRPRARTPFTTCCACGATSGRPPRWAWPTPTGSTATTTTGCWASTRTSCGARSGSRKCRSPGRGLETRAALGRESSGPSPSATAPGARTATTSSCSVSRRASRTRAGS